MREFLSYVLESFRDATGWSRDGGYADLNVTANELLNFPTPRGLRMTLSSLATPHFATGYALGSVGVVDGSISYLYSSVPLAGVVAQSDRIPLPTLLRSYRQRRRGPAGRRPTLARRFHAPPRPPLEPAALAALLPFATAPPPPPGDGGAPSPSVQLLLPAADWLAGVLHEACALADKPALLYGRLYLPRSMLEAYTVKRLAPSVQLELRAVSDARLPSGGTVLGAVQVDRGRYGLEGLVSSDGGLLGVRGLYHFGTDPAAPAEGGATTTTTTTTPTTPTTPTTASQGEPRLHGRFSAGGEIYYGTLNKSGGLSLGARFQTTVEPPADEAAAAAAALTPHGGPTSAPSGTPLTATLTINPLMGNLSAAYAVVAREDCSLATRFDFNVYSYESEWSVGMELWSTRRLAGLVAVDEPDVSAAATPSSSSPSPATSSSAPAIPERSFQAKLEWRLDELPKLGSKADGMPGGPTRGEAGSPASSQATDSQDTNKGGAVDSSRERQYQGVLKARLDQNLKMGLLWEGRLKSLLFSLGTAVDLHRLDQPFRTLGLEIQFSS